MTRPATATQRVVTPGIRVEPVRGRRDLTRFLRVPWRIYERDPAWVPPLLLDQRTLLNRKKHPFHQHAEVEYFLARRGDEIVGRVAAIVNHRHVEFHEERTGFFGFFESVQDPSVAAALLEAAENWISVRGMECIRGPMNLSTNEECGLLVDGFESPPLIMMTHHPRYYARLIEAAGYAKAKDLLAYWLDDSTPPERLVRGVARIEARLGVRVRPLEMRRFREEVGKVQEVYNSAWERNWGFVPMTDAEFAHLARDLRTVIEPSLCVIAETDREPVGFALALPDYNQALRHIDGRLFPFGLFKLLWHRRRIDRARVLTLGLKPGYRRRGLDAVLYLRLFEAGARVGYHRGECSWILEDNWEMRRGLERMGARIHRTYRIYEKALG